MLYFDSYQFIIINCQSRGSAVFFIFANKLSINFYNMQRVKPIASKTGELIAYSEVAIRNNISAVEYCRTSMAAISGCAAGM